MPRVAVLGGGVAGLTAADELSQRHFEVHVFERRDQLGGKARSFLSAPIGNLGQLPAEHGFRFFPGFYRHLPDTMGNIPYGDNSNVAENLVEANQFGLLRSGESETLVPASAWGFIRPWNTRLRLTRHPFIDNLSLKPEDIAFLAKQMIKLLSTCRERRLMQYETTSWWDYCEADKRSAEYEMIMRAMTRSLVAAQADLMSARTGGDILAQLQFAVYRFRGHPDRLLNGPTSDVWIEPWRQKLERAGVDLYPEHEVTGFDLDGQHISNVRAKAPSGEKDLNGYDFYVCALPVEVMRGLVDDRVKEAAPSLANLDKLCVRWMNGFMLYLRKRLTAVQGHCVYIDSPWALTSVSQAQFWPGHLGWIKPGEIEDILSIDISDWFTRGKYVPKIAAKCSHEEIRKEVVCQLQDYTRDTPWASYLADENIVGYYIDPDVRRPNPREDVNLEPLFINTKGSWASRPESRTEIDNLFLAADYVRTYTDLATMEGANEAARRAVNYILDKSSSKEPRCKLWPLHEPHILAHRRFIDKQRYRREDSETFKQAKIMLKALRAIRARAHPRAPA